MCKCTFFLILRTGDLPHAGGRACNPMARPESNRGRCHDLPVDESDRNPLGDFCRYHDILPDLHSMKLLTFMLTPPGLIQTPQSLSLWVRFVFLSIPHGRIWQHSQGTRGFSALESAGCDVFILLERDGEGIRNHLYFFFRRCLGGWSAFTADHRQRAGTPVLGPNASHMS